MASDYATVGEAKTSAGLNGEDFADPEIKRALTAASRGLDQLTSRRFWLDADDTSVRYYTPENTGWLQIDDIVDLVSLQTGDGRGTFPTTWTENTDYILEPLNAEADGTPWDHVTATGKAFTRATRTVKITGQFGWAETPVGVKEATIILASKLVRRVREAPFGVVTFGEDNVMRIARSDPDVMFLVGDFIRNPVPIG